MGDRISMGGALAAATAILAGAGSAAAQPPEAMTYMEIAKPIIACDTHDEMTEIVKAMSGGRLKEKMTEFARVKNKKGESVCVYSPLAPVLFGESEHIGRVEQHNAALDVWITRVGNEKMKFYILWGETVKETMV